MSSLAVESWTWYGATWLVVVTRIVSQILLRGSVKKLKLDDILMVFIMVTDTILMITLNIIVVTNSNLIDPKNPPLLSPGDISERQFGSKMVLLAEQMQCITIWLTKACLLLLYHRLTSILRSSVLVRAVACYVVFGFITMELLYFGVWCRPFSQYWAVPPHSTQCSAATNHLITNAVINISSDVMIISIPLRLLLELLQSMMPLKTKCFLAGVFALGGFTIVSSVLNKLYSFNEPFGTQWPSWYIRESSTAIIVANLPLTCTIFQRLFNLRSCDHHRSLQEVRAIHSDNVIPIPRQALGSTQVYSHIKRSNTNDDGNNPGGVAEADDTALQNNPCDDRRARGGPISLNTTTE